ncbi:hypothetical protein HWB03_gp76 [Salmonella phage ST-101]|uniref:Uncharacterized protein n=1 Tax=Salmonella phage ST-101 TaxID=1897739 RepID=A0A5H2BKB8_9CAUD|nr:hypothetical protein HWB03_gp76 [Salmonella phage ST-101]ARB12001.1 hypothetical protein STCF101_0077 [Salmonella phage ST-101]
MRLFQTFGEHVARQCLNDVFHQLTAVAVDLAPLGTAAFHLAFVLEVGLCVLLAFLRPLLNRHLALDQTRAEVIHFAARRQADGQEWLRVFDDQTAPHDGLTGTDNLEYRVFEVIPCAHNFRAKVAERLYRLFGFFLRHVYAHIFGVAPQSGLLAILVHVAAAEAIARAEGSRFGFWAVWLRLFVRQVQPVSREGAVKVVLGRQRVHEPFAVRQPSDNHGFDGRQVGNDELVARRRDEGGADAAHQRVHRLANVQRQRIKVALVDHLVDDGQVGHVLNQLRRSRQVLGLDTTASPTVRTARPGELQ